jgi:hypothetical protein
MPQGIGVNILGIEILLRFIGIDLYPLLRFRFEGIFPICFEWLGAVAPPGVYIVGE